MNYTDFDRVEGAGKRKTVYYGTIIYNNGEWSVDKIPLQSVRTGQQRVYPAKPGYAMVLTYNAKEKTIHLELLKMRN